MEATKKLNGKAVGKWLSNNAIIMMMLAVTPVSYTHLTLPTIA